MSRLAKKPIIIPEKVKVEIGNSRVDVSGPLGKLFVQVNPKINLKMESSSIFVSTQQDEREDKVLRGLAWSLIRNACKGVSQGFDKDLEIRGVGYQSKLDGNKLIFQLRFTHPVEFKIPEGIKITLDPKGILIKVSGFDKQLVGETAAKIRRIFPAEHYKGTGIRYVGERVIKKAGKTAIGVGAGAGAGAGGGAKK